MARAVTTTRKDKLTVERLMADIEQGILDDDIENYMPSELFGPPTAAELAAEARGARTNGKHPRSPSRRAAKRASHSPASVTIRPRTA